MVHGSIKILFFLFCIANYNYLQSSDAVLRSCYSEASDQSTNTRRTTGYTLHVDREMQTDPDQETPFLLIVWQYEKIIVHNKPNTPAAVIRCIAEQCALMQYARIKISRNIEKKQTELAARGWMEWYRQQNPSIPHTRTPKAPPSTLVTTQQQTTLNTIEAWEPISDSEADWDPTSPTQSMPVFAEYRQRIQDTIATVQDAGKTFWRRAKKTITFL